MKFSTGKAGIIYGIASSFKLTSAQLRTTHQTSISYVNDAGVHCNVIPGWRDEIHTPTVEEVEANFDCQDTQVKMSCTIEGNNQDCDSKSMSEDKLVCESKPTRLCFIYTPDKCDSSLVGKNGLDSCSDFGGSSVEVEAVVVDSIGNLFLSDPVRSGDEFCLEDDILPEQLFLSANDLDTEENLQSVVIDISCSGNGLMLNNKYGSFQLSSYTNADGERNCFVDVYYEYIVTNIGSGHLKITEFNRTWNGEERSLTEEIISAGRDLEWQESVTVREAAVIARCVESFIEKTATVVTEGNDTQTFQAKSELAFPVIPGTLPHISAPSLPHLCNMSSTLCPFTSNETCSHPCMVDCDEQKHATWEETN